MRNRNIETLNARVAPRKNLSRFRLVQIGSVEIILFLHMLAIITNPKKLLA